MTAKSDEHEPPDYRSIFEAAPSPNLIVRAEPPFVIVAANDAYLAATMTTREGIVGRGIFDAFPDNPNDPDASGTRKVGESIQYVITRREPHTMAVQRYDVPHPDGSGFDERYWSPIHTPVFGPDGKVAYVLQRPEDVTEFVRLKALVGDQDRREEQLRDRADRMEAEIYLRAQELAAANADLRQQIEEREQAEAALAREEDFLRAVLDHAADGIVACDGDGVLRFFNRAARTFHGMAERPLPPEQWAEQYDLFLPDGVTRMTKEQVPLYRALGEGLVKNVEMVIAARDHPRRLLTANGRAITDAEGRRLGAVVVMHDMTDRKLGEEQRERAVREEAGRKGAEASSQRLRESEERFRLMADAVPQIVWITDAQGRVEFFNQQWSKYTGITHALATSDDVAAAAVHPDDRATTKSAFQVAMRTGQTFAIEHRILSAAGEYRWFLVRGEPSHDPQSGQIARWFGASVDIHDRRLAEDALRGSEERFRQLADAMPQMVWVTRPDGYHEYYNRRWYDFTGVAEGSTDGEGWNELFHLDDQARAWAAWRNSLATGEPYEVEYRLRHRSSEYRWTLGRALPIRDADGVITKWFGTCTDIDGIKRLHEDRERLLDSERNARTEAERAGRMKDEFLATLSHELRTPLNAILGWSQILVRAKNLPTELADGLRTIERNARSQAQIIEDLLDMSRIISGKVRLDVQRVDLALLLRDAVETAKPSADAKGIHLAALLDATAGPVSGDPSRLQQVMWNLISNALKFTPKGGRVQVSLERANSQVEASVTDSGEGIKPEFLPFVFDRFRQADGSTTRRHGGLGLGLSIVKQLVELHGGSVRVQSAGSGKGATFTVSLPLVAIDAGPVSNSDRRHIKADDAASALLPDMCAEIAGVKVLVVDDEPDARTLLKRLLEDCNAVVFTAASASEALATLQAERPDVLVSDVGMPIKDGYELMKLVRALADDRGGKTPALALTAYARAEDRMQAIRAGFQMHVPKPVEPAELITMVASLAGRA